MSTKTTHHVYQRTFTIPAPPARVFVALTSAGELQRWFAEHVEVDPRVGGVYRFWGRFTIWGDAKSTADQRITHFQRPSSFGFSWTWNGEPTEVLIELREQEGETALELTHSFFEMKNPEAESTADFWITAIGNLRCYLQTGAPALMPDVTGRGGSSISLSILIDASPDEVFRSLTDPSELNQWIAKQATAELRVGGAFNYGWASGCHGDGEAAGPTKILAISSNRLLETDWHHGPLRDSRVRWELQPVGTQTRITLMHSGFSDNFNRAVHMQGWARYLLSLHELQTRVSAVRTAG